MAAPTPGGWPAGPPLLAALVSLQACGQGAEARVAQRILERYGTSASARPLAAAQVIKLRLTGPGNARGAVEISWQGLDYRERRESAGLVTVRGLQGGKAFYTDEDAVTRVASEPAVRELTTRSYFWRRAFLFRDHEKEPPALGPADEATASVRFGLRLGNPLQLVFSRRDGALTAVHSPRFHLEFDGPTRFRDISDPASPIQAEIAWIGLPTGPLAGVSAGGGRARFRGAFADLPMEFSGTGPVVAAAVAGAPARVRIDGAAGGLVRISAELARKTGLAFAPDALGRQVAGPCELAFEGLVFPSVHLQRVGSGLDGVDAAVGGPVFRETVVELDAAAGRLRFHDPAVWPVPEGFQRFLIDDDDNLPVAPLHRGSREFRVVLGVADPGGGIVLAPAAARRLGLSADLPEARDLGWSNHVFPAVSVSIGTAPRAPDWGDDGTLAWRPLAGYRTFIDMSRRWIYLARVTLGVSSPSPPPPPPPQRRAQDARASPKT
ncbi:MAG: hypothetical protein ACRD00_07130 [Thermoanaerobaculia bacterium]